MTQLLTQHDIERTPGACFVYYGERGDWPIVATRHRDSDMIERHNFEVMQAALGMPLADDVAIESASHWAVGYVERLLVHPGSTDKLAIATECAARIEEYPILDEMAYSDWTVERHAERDCSHGCDMCESEREQRRAHDRDDCAQFDSCIACEEESDDDEGDD